MSSKRKNSTYSRLQQATLDSLTSKCVVYSTIKHSLHKRPQEEVEMRWSDICKMLADFDKSISKEELVKTGSRTFPITRGSYNGYISVSVKSG